MTIDNSIKDVYIHTHMCLCIHGHAKKKHIYVISPMLWFYFLLFHLPLVNYSLKIGKSSTIKYFERERDHILLQYMCTHIYTHTYRLEYILSIGHICINFSAAFLIIKYHSIF